MVSGPSRLDAQARGWKTLRGLHPIPIDLDRLQLIRERLPSELSQCDALEELVLRLGLNDEGLDEYPPQLHPFCGHGLRIWQYPKQFARYLANVTSLGVRSYLEVGVRHGGSFVATVELLQRFGALDHAVAVDIIACPALDTYARSNACVRCAWLNTQSAAFEELLDGLGNTDLVFIDSHHEEAQCRLEIAVLAARANILALHDVSNVRCPGVAKVWNEIKEDSRFQCFEYAEQYGQLGPYMGIGLAVRKDRMWKT
jgi:hypothetical protein